MSDSWYRTPPDLPPYEDGFGRFWSLDGVQVGGPPEVEPDWPQDWPEELRWHLLQADIIMSVRDEFERQMEVAMQRFFSGRMSLFSGDWPEDPGLGLNYH